MASTAGRFRPPSDEDDDAMELDGQVVGVAAVKPGPNINPPPIGKRDRSILDAGNYFTGPYRSVFTLNLENTTPRVLECLKHVNCDYLSTKGLPPTLLQLKQHAQSLTVLIKHITVSTLPATIDNASIQPPAQDHAAAYRFLENESYDWLNDLTKPYSNNNRHHQIPLTSLLNTIERNPFTLKPIDTCPLHAADPEKIPRNGHSLPYATHQTLIKHANEILEMLAHEYSATGGLLSILPPDDKEHKEDRKNAEETVLGQFIIYAQRLVLRLHELERQYANALDVMEGEAAIPLQMLSRLGPMGRKDRLLAYPQDRFVLVNAGEDVWQFLNNELERKDVVETEYDNKWRELGVTGEKLWTQKGTGEAARGITHLDVTTRYYRLRGSPLKTIFIIPAHQEHPGTKVTREMESQPTVVTVTKPVWPERVSTWEMKHRSDLEEYKKIKVLYRAAEEQLEFDKDEINVLAYDAAEKAKQLKEVQAQKKELEEYLQTPVNQIRNKSLEEITRANVAREEAIAKQQKLAEERETVRLELEDVQRKKQELQQWKNSEERKLGAVKDKLDQQEKDINDRDADMGRAAHELNAKYKALWIKKMTDSQVLIEFLRREDARNALGSLKPSQEDRDQAAAAVQRILDDEDNNNFPGGGRVVRGARGRRGRGGVGRGGPRHVQVEDESDDTEMN